MPDPDYESFGSAPVGVDYAEPYIPYETFPSTGVVVAPIVSSPASALPFLIRAPRRPVGQPDLQQVDIDVVDDLPPTFRLAYGPKVLANYIARELITPDGFLAVNFDGDPNYGKDVRGRLNSAWSVKELSALATAIETKIRRHDRVESTEVHVSHNLATSTLTVDIVVTTAAGPFKFVLAVSDVSVELLQPD